MTTGAAPAPGMPRVSIVIPVYNGADYLDEAIRSALAQTYPHLEVLVVDDGSTDGGATERVARAHGDRIRYLRKPNGGVATALNAGIQAMTGEYFSWLSHDDLYTPDKVEAEVQALRALDDPRVVAYCAFEEIGPDGAPLGTGSALHRYPDPLAAILASAVHGCSLLVPRRAFDEAGGFNPALRSTQDTEMWLRMVLAGFSFHYVPRVLVKSRQHPQQGSRTMTGHAEERARLYRWAVDALEPRERLRNAATLAEALLAMDHVGVYLHLVRRVRGDGGPVAPLLAALARRGPRLARHGAGRVLRRLRNGAGRPHAAPAERG